MATKEETYDNEIAPLMTQVIATCKANGINFVATFELDMDEEEGRPLHCSSGIVLPGAGPLVSKVYDCVVERPISFGLVMAGKLAQTD